MTWSSDASSRRELAADSSKVSRRPASSVLIVMRAGRGAATA
jgi:hypothetical protein